MLNSKNRVALLSTLRLVGLSVALVACPSILTGCGGSNTAERPESYGPAPKSDDAKMEGSGGSDTEESSEPIAAP